MQNSIIQLFQVGGSHPVKINQSNEVLSKSLRELLVRDTSAFFNCQHIGTNLSVDSGSSISSLAINSHARPIIIDIKQSLNENIVIRGWEHSNWVQGHSNVISAIYRQKLEGVKVDWDAPKVICISGEFTVEEISVAKEFCHSGVDLCLKRCHRIGDNYLVFEDVILTKDQDANKGKRISNKGVNSYQPTIFNVDRILSEGFVPTPTDQQIKTTAGSIGKLTIRHCDIIQENIDRRFEQTTEDLRTYCHQMKLLLEFNARHAKTWSKTTTKHKSKKLKGQNVLCPVCRRPFYLSPSAISTAKQGDSYRTCGDDRCKKAAAIDRRQSKEFGQKRHYTPKLMFLKN